MVYYQYITLLDITLERKGCEMKNYEGKFSIEIEGDKLVINEWQGETKSFPMSRIPCAEIADCLRWLSDEEIGELVSMVGKGRVARGARFARKMRWIN